jgi:dihydroneopterin aldolase
LTLAEPPAMRTLYLERLRVHASVGILDYELRSRQQVLVSMHVEMQHAPDIPQADEVGEVLDYRAMREIAKQEAEGPHINMLETLTGRIAQRLLALPGVTQALVRVTKPNIFPDCDGVTVEVVTRRPEPESSPT